jgi:hypothetical protein
MTSSIDILMSATLPTAALPRAFGFIVVPLVHRRETHAWRVRGDDVLVWCA